MEQEIAGEKMLSRHIYQKVQANEQLLLEMREEMTGLRGEMTSLRADVNKLKTDMTDLRADMPGIVGEAVCRPCGRRADRRFRPDSSGPG